VVIGRGRVLADASVAELIGAVANGRVAVRTGSPVAAEVLRRAGATVTATGPGALSVTGLASAEIVALLSGNAVPFSEVSAHRATLEDAYFELTRDAVEFRGARR
jgi:ABC-2 type transport system ATP-binding protein